MPVRCWQLKISPITKCRTRDETGTPVLCFTLSKLHFHHSGRKCCQVGEQLPCAQDIGYLIGLGLDCRWELLWGRKEDKNFSLGNWAKEGRKLEKTYSECRRMEHKGKKWFSHLLASQPLPKWCQEKHLAREMPCLPQADSNPSPFGLGKRCSVWEERQNALCGSCVATGLNYSSRCCCNKPASRQDQIKACFHDNRQNFRSNFFHS